MISDIEKLYDDIAYNVFQIELSKVAREAAREAMQTVNLAEILDNALPGLEGDAFERIIIAGQSMKDKSVSYVGLSHPSEIRWEEQADAMEVSFN